MHLPRHTIESHAAVPLFQHASFCSPHPVSLPDSLPGSTRSGASTEGISQPAVFSCATLNGFMVAQSDPLRLVSNRTWSSSQGGLSLAVPVQHTSLLLLVGGGRVPRFAPNKVVLWDEAAEYTAKRTDGSSRDADSDDDDLSSASSRRASTIFSAGSEFDAYSKPSADDFEHVDSLEQDPAGASSPINNIQFSTSSPIDAQDIHDVSASVSTQFAASTQGESGMEHSFGASSLGIGRLQDSRDSEEAHRTGTSSALLEISSPDLSSSLHSHSIMSSSANLADPFSEEDSRSAEAKPSPSDRPLPISTSVSHRPTLDGSSSAAQSLFSSQLNRPTGSALVDSVSSLATTATDATAQARPQILHGREVAELEFSEVVRGIYATSVHAAPARHKHDSSKGKARASVDYKNIRKPRSSRFCVVLVVVLSSKAVIFELSPPSTATNLDGNPISSNWRIQKRTAVATYKNPKGLGSVAPYYGNLAMPSAIVALPGRQKGHVQLLYIKLQSLAVLDAVAPILANATSSVGAASIIVAHESSIAAIALSPNGVLLATASSKGTLIRVWSNNLAGGSVTSKERRSSIPGRTGFGARLIRELRRGTDPATILSIAFTPDASLVAAASDKGTIHIFLLDVASMAVQGSSGDSNALPSTTSSRTANLGRAAAQYLPSSLGSLAGQIPPSVLPQYLKSEWSSAQFRIPLKSFGASSRHYTAPSADDGSLYGAGAQPAKPAGTEKSTDGAWAQMRSRISDIRKGEASVEESIFLCWIVEASPPAGRLSALAAKGSGQDKECSRSDKTRSRTSTPQSSDTDHPPSAEHQNCLQYRLLALTTSGGWYKLAVTLPKVDTDDKASGSTVLDMYRTDTASQSKRVNPLGCQLLEFRPMAALLDGWRA